MAPEILDLQTNFAIGVSVRHPIFTFLPEHQGVKSLPTEAAIVSFNKELEPNAENLVALKYSRYGEKPLEVQDVLRDLVSDTYSRRPEGTRSIILGTTNKSGDEVTGTLRLVVGAKGKDGILPLDAMNFVEACPWPHQEEGLQENEVGELGRFALSDLLTEDCERYRATRNLLNLAFSISDFLKIRMLYAIMPKHVLKHVQNAGLRVEQVTNTRLRAENPAALDVFRKYPRYWHAFEDSRWQPRLYTLDTQGLDLDTGQPIPQFT